MVAYRLSRRGPARDYELLREEIRKRLMKLGNGRISTKEIREAIRSIGAWSASRINRNGDMEVSRAELREWLLQGLRGEQKPTFSIWGGVRRADRNLDVVIDKHEMDKLVEYAGENIGLRFVN